MKRRTLLLAGTTAAGALVVGWGAMPQRSRLGAGTLMRPTQGEVALNGWIKIGADGGVVLAMPRCEMGQGVHTALAMLAAEELDVALADVRLEQAAADTLYGNVAFTVDALPFHPSELESGATDGFNRVQFSRRMVGKFAREIGINATGGSSTVADLWMPVRTAAATARASLVGAASLQWRFPVDELTVANGVVSHASGKSARYGELAAAAGATPPGEVQLKDRQRWKLLGRPAQRIDVPAKCDGRAVYGIDVRLPGLKFAVVRFAPYLHGQVQRLDAARALALPGAERIVQFPPYAGAPGGFAVIGKTSWHAARAAAAVDVEWAPPPSGELADSGRIAAALAEVAVHGSGFVFYERGSLGAAPSGNRIEATYSAPYLAHATLEPMNCTCLVGDGRVELWVPTQVPQLCGEAAAQVAGVAPGDVTVHATLLGGGFGRRLEVDYAAIATRVAMDVAGVPVQVLWPREEDMRHDYYRPMHAAQLRAELDTGGRPVSLRIQSAGDAITPRWLRRVLPSGMRDVIGALQLTAPTLPGVRAQSGPLDMPDRTASEGLFDIPYGVPNLRVSHVATQSGVPVGFWRSVGHSHNAFFAESFIDELAHAAHADPVEYRRSLLREAPRYRAVLDLAAKQSGWGAPLLKGRARGVALHESFGTIVAQVAEVSVENGTIRVHRVVCALDCGTVINPGIVAQQMEGAVVYGLTAALHGRIDIRNGQVQQRNFTDYRMLGAAQAPKVETWIVPSERPPAGIGEPAVPPVAPAVGNALFTLTSKRLRSLPLDLGTADS